MEKDNMVDKTIKIKVATEADMSEAEDLKNFLESIEDVSVNVETNVDDEEIDDTLERMDELNDLLDEVYPVDIEVEDGEIDSTIEKLDEADNSVINIETIVEGDEEVDAVDEKVENVNGKTISIETTVEGDEQVDEVDEKVETVNGKTITIPVTVEGEEQLDAVSEKVEQLNGKSVNIDVNTEGESSLDGITGKLGTIAGGIGMVDQATKMWDASTQRQSSNFYLASKMGTEQAQKMQKEIQNIVAAVPGDDTFMNVLLSGAVARETTLTTNQLKSLGTAAADYMMSAKSVGMNAIEAQQDLNSYILSGNTAELERSRVVGNQIDKLKDKATVEERIVALQEALNAEGWAGMSEFDTASNNLEEFQGRLEKARADWGDVFLPLEQGALKAALALDDDFGGAVGMAIVAVEGLIPTVVGGVSAFGEFKRGYDALADIAPIAKLGKGFKDFFGVLKSGVTGAISSVASGFSSLFTILASNPILIVVIAVVALVAALIYLYYTNEDVRNAIDGFLSWIGGAWESAVSTVTGAIEWLSEAWQNVVDFFQTYGQTLLEVFFVVSTGGVGAIILLVANFLGMPNQIGGALQKMIQNIINFGTNLVNNLVNSAKRSVTNFINEINKAPQEFVDELNKMIDDAIDFATNLPQILWDAGANAVSNFLSGLGRHSPGTMQREMVAELTEIADLIPGLIDAIGNNLTLIAGKADEFVGQITDKMSTGMSSTDAILSTGMEWIMNGVAQLLNTMGLNGDAFVQTWWNMGTNTIQAVNNLIANISSLPSRISSYLSSVIGNVSSFASNFVSRLGSAATNAVSRFTNGIKNLSKGLVDELNEMLSQALNFAGKLGSALYNLGVNAVKNFLSGIGRNSPGIIQNEMLAELSETATRVPESQGLMVRNISKYADSIVTAWGKPTFKYDFELGNIDNNVDISQSNLSDALNNILNLLNSRSNNGNTFNFTLNGDMDNEERMQKFIDAIIKEINWHNETAGRTAGTITL